MNDMTQTPIEMSPTQRNFVALGTIVRREVNRILRIWGQTLVPPAITMTLYFLIFGGLIGSRVGTMDGIKYMDFIVPGLVMMSVIQNSYGNISSSFFGAKFGRHVEELLVSPMPAWVILGGYVYPRTGVALGPLPMFPLLAALPDNGPVAGWTAGLMAVPPVVAAVAAVRAQRRHPTVRWEEGALRGCTGGVLAGVVTGLLATLAGGSAGPGRMTDVGPFSFDVLVHAITAFGIGGLFGGLVMTWWQRRALRRGSLHSGT